jgi:gluconokinase
MIVLVMGPTGVGKTTIGTRLAERLGVLFADGDDFHPAANVEKMSRGVPLTDADRWPWLAAIRMAMEGWARAGTGAVLACSALKQAYRDALYRGPEVRLVWLTASEAVIRERLRRRAGHFAGEALLASQIAIAEPPADAIAVDVAGTPDAIVDAILARLGQRAG